MVYQWSGVLWELCDLHTAHVYRGKGNETANTILLESLPDIEVGVVNTAHSKIVGCCQDLNAMRESPMPANILLEGCLGQREEFGLALPLHITSPSPGSSPS